MKSILSFAAIVALVLSIGRPAEARTDRELTYRPTQIWNSAVRFLRVDQSFKILEKDKDSAYVLFEYKDSGRPYQASFEMVPVVKDNKRFVRVRFSIAEMPSYVEAVLADTFLRKLKDEHGVPPPPRVLAPSPAAKTEGEEEADKGKSKSKATKPGVDEDDENDADDEDELEIIEDDVEGDAEEE